MVKIRNSGLKERLYRVASLQGGYFSAKQAIGCGYGNNNFMYFVHKQEWIPVIRGIYRLRDFPDGERDEYSLWSLWVGLKGDRPIGVYSHLTALSYYELSEVIYPKLCITVPERYKTSRKIPKILSIYKDNIAETDINFIGVYAMTKPERTLIDVAGKGMMDMDHLANSVLLAYEKAYISKSFIYRRPEFDGILPMIEERL